MSAVSLAIGFLLGIIGSAIAALLYEYGTRPLLRVVLADAPYAGREVEGKPPHGFYHLKVRNMPAAWPLPARKPAWSVQARLEVIDGAGKPMFDPIICRWVSQPEPVTPAVARDQQINLIDPARLMFARKIDVHSHEDQLLDVAVKYEGTPDCHLFTNESYFFRWWQNPAWRVPQGDHGLRVTLLYDRGAKTTDFILRNRGPRRDDLTLVAA